MKAQEENTKSQPTTSTKASAQTVEIAEISKTLSQNHTFSVYIGRQTDWGGVSHGPVTRGQREAASYFSYAVHAIDATTHPTTRRIIYETFFRCTVFLLFVFSLISWPVPKASADEVPILSEMTYPDQIAFLARSGVEIPGGEENYEYWKLFIQECISIVENDPSYMFRYNWSVSQEFSMTIQRAVNSHYGITPNFVAKVQARSVTGLTDSVALADWDASFINYNCYSYALGITTRTSEPGVFCGLEQPTTLTIDSIAELIILDLRTSTLGYPCVKQYTDDVIAVLADETICVRLSQNRADYHFMIRDLAEWKHKPGVSSPLKYLYDDVWTRDWTNEGLEYGAYTYGTLIYNSEIYYFQPRSAHSLSDSYTYTGGHYHSGTFHFYEIQRYCS